MPAIETLRPRPEVLDFLLSRRSRPARTLRSPAPDRATLETILTAAARSPDHGKLEPWRFVVVTSGALPRLAARAEARARDLSLPDEKVEKLRAMFADAPALIAVLAAPQPSDKIPEVEQILSVGAASLGLVNAAHAAGFGANWLTGALAADEPFLQEALGAEPGQWAAAFVVVGTESAVPPERPRPDLHRVARWIEA